MATIGTACFTSIQSALAYYAHYGYDSLAVADKIDCNEIVIGEPELKEGEILHLNKSEGRYMIRVED